MAKTYPIVGANYCKAEEFVKTLQHGTPVVLVREPTNAFDPNAVAVWAGDRRIGYIPKKQNQALAAFIDQAGGNAVVSRGMALDQDIVAAGPNLRAFPAVFVRSPNSAFPMVQLSE